MKMKKLKITVLLWAFLPCILMAQHQIQGTFSPAEHYTYAILYQSTPTALHYVDRAKIGNDGHFEIALDASVEAGMYQIVYGIPQDENSFDFIYDGKEDIRLTFSLENGLEFKESSENKLWASYTNSMELVNMTISNYYAQESADKKAFTDIFKTLKDTQIAFEEASKDKMVSTFIQANRPYIPSEYETAETYSNNLKSNFLKNVDFGNALLQNSDFLIDRVIAYVFGITSTNNNHHYKSNIDTVAKAIGNDKPFVSTVLLEHLWKKMVEIGNLEVANYISDTYLFKLARDTNNKELYQNLMVYKNSAVGATAMDFPIVYENEGKPVNTSLHQLSGSSHYLLVFWSSTCGHCLDELPKLKSFLDEKPRDLKVVAFGLENNKEHWKQTITTLQGFIHVLGLEHWNNPVAMAYGIESTPTYLILDKDKKIIYKPNTLAELKSDLNRLE